MDENEAGILEFRKRKDEFYRSGAESPLGPQDKAEFQGLKYFPYDSKYLVKARFVPYPDPEQVSLATSRGVKVAYFREGRFEFILAGKGHVLQAYRSVHGTHSEGYFIPFKDATSGKESYANGRYLEIGEDGPRTEGGEYWLDFNRAYNPYCAYVEGYMCPYPPEENTLQVPIRAGEKKYR
jgi:uncharacterized protein (DUF1684 family)